MLNKKLGFADPLLSYVLEQFEVAGVKISPRIAIEAAEVLDQCGPECLDFIADFKSKPEILKQAVSKFQGMIEVENIRKELGTFAKEFASLDLSNSEGLAEGVKVNAKIFTTVSKLKVIKADDSVIQTTTELIKTFTKQYDTNKKNLELLASQSPVVKEDSSF